MYSVYVLKSIRDKKRYIGFTNNLERRIIEHNSGLVKSTRNRKPFELAYHEEFADKNKAMEREKFFKSGRGREFLKTHNY